MKRLDVVFSHSAARDLDDIFHYIWKASRNPGIARAYVERIEERCHRIGNAPLGGRQRDDLAKGLRLTPFEKRAVIAYFVEDGQVVISNVFYGGKDYEALFLAE